ncbi:MAG: DUF58 domain-containing protein [Nanoarchaeota archaeon]|nr:DUF58 domain-containing protein [Nanoarchaeota archaeon]
MAKQNKRRLNVEVTPIVKKIEALTKRLVRTQILGEYISLFKGGGLEFDGFKDYNPALDASEIDWKASVRTKKLLVKKYREVRELEIYFLLDVSQSMIFGSTKKLKNEYAAEFLLAMAYTILSAGDAVGLIAFSDQVMHITQANKGTPHFYQMADQIIDPDLYGGGFNFDAGEKFALNFIKKKGSVVIVISDFYGLQDKAWQHRMRLMAAKFDLICILVRDPRDKSLPDKVGQVIVQDPYTHERLLIDSSLLQERYSSFTKKQDKNLFAFFDDHSIDYMELSTDQDYLESLFKFFDMRRRKKWR